MTFNRKKAEKAEADFIADPSIKNRNTLIMCHENMIYRMINRYGKSTPNLHKDMYQEGMIGLIHAATTFNPDRNLKFITHATWWIRHYIQDCLEHDQSISKWCAKRAILGTCKTSTKKHSVPIEDAYHVQDELIDIEEEVYTSEKLKILEVLKPICCQTEVDKEIWEKNLFTPNHVSQLEISKKYNLSRTTIGIKTKKLEKRIKKEVIKLL